ncbi:MAG TPA: hypothetical protein VIT67_15110 [Povalibacter sp.]
MRSPVAVTFIVLAFLGTSVAQADAVNVKRPQLQLADAVNVKRPQIFA